MKKAIFAKIFVGAFLLLGVSACSSMKKSCSKCQESSSEKKTCSKCEEKGCSQGDCKCGDGCEMKKEKP